jgi:ATP-binding cassette subfamily B multidrug efflux pump
MAEKGSAFSFPMFRQLYRRSGPYRGIFWITVVLVLVLAAMSPVRPVLVQKIVDEHLFLGHEWDVLKLSMLFVVVLLIEAGIQFFQTYLANKVAQSITLDMRSELYQHVIRFRLKYFDKTPVGQFVTRLISDIDGIAEVFSVGLLDIMRDILKLVVIVGYMFYMDWQMTLIVLIPIPILIYATRLFQVAVRKSFQDVRNQVARINVFIQEHVTGMNIVQIFNQEEREAYKFENINREHRDAHIRGIWAYSVFFPVVELLSAASIALMLWWGVGAAMISRMEPGALLSFSLFITMMYRPIRQMADNFNVLQMGVVNAERVFKVFETKEAELDEGSADASLVRGQLDCQDLWFAYSDENWVLKGLNLHIPAGKMTAIVGATGSGKSSLVNLFNRFYEYQKGQVSLDGKCLSEYDLASLRKNVGLVLQDVFLFSDTIYNNITLHDNSITREEVIQGAKEVGVHDFIMSLPGGYEYNVHERGGMLSVGQRQLISFVRAYVTKPKILILDEATSSIDSESERLISYATAQLTKNRTSVVIAHRLSTIQNADQIAVMDHGKIVEIGSHEQLMAADGMYRKLFLLQFISTNNE